MVRLPDFPEGGTDYQKITGFPWQGDLFPTLGKSVDLRTLATHGPLLGRVSKAEQKALEADRSRFGSWFCHLASNGAWSIHL